MRQRQIQQARAVAAAERQALLAAPRIARGAGIVGRAAGLFGRAATVAAGPEAAAAVALSGLAYGVGEDLLSNYGYANSTKSMPQRQRTPLNDPTSRGTRKVAHKHIKETGQPLTESPTAIPTAPPKPKAIPIPTAEVKPTQPTQPEVQVVPVYEPPPPMPPQQPEVQASPAPISSPIIPPRPEIAPLPPQQPEVQSVYIPPMPVVQLPGRFQRSLIDLNGLPQPVHGFHIPRGRPYNLSAWERATMAKARGVRGY